MNSEPKVEVAILSDNSIECILYGDYLTDLSEKLLNGKITARIENDKIVLSQNDKEFKPVDEIVLEPTEDKSDTFLLKNVTIGLKFH